MKFAFLLTAIVLSSYSQPEKYTGSNISAESERESVIESVQKMTQTEVEKESEPYRTWLNAQRSGVCEIHHAKMYRQWIPVTYGLPVAGSFPDPEESKRFPHGEEYWLGGCMVAPIKEREVFLCPECVSAFRAWQKREKLNQAPEPTSGRTSGHNSS